MITIAGIDFDYHDYDGRGDVLFLHLGPPDGPPAKALETAEGHTVEYDEHGAIVGRELMGVGRERAAGKASPRREPVLSGDLGSAGRDCSLILS